MIPTTDQAYQLWETYHLSERKRQHSKLVAEVAKWIALHIEAHTHMKINHTLIYVSALLHDIDKAIPWRDEEHHPDTGVRVLQELGMEEIAMMVKTHPLHAIIDPAISPKTIEEKILYFADKMTKYDVISVEERFAIWRAEQLSSEERDILERSYPKVKELEQELCTLAGVTPEQLSNECKNDILQQERKTL